MLVGIVFKRGSVHFMKRSYWLLIFLLLSVTVATVQAQESAKVQEFFSLVTPETPFVYFDLFGMREGETIYLYAESEEFDTKITLCDLTCEKDFAENDDISTRNFNSALEYTFEEDGDYSIKISDCCDEAAAGIFRLLVGFNAPSVLDGTAEPNGAEIAVPYSETYTDLTATITNREPQVQEFIGEVGGENRFTYYDIFGALAGETLYVYVESDEIDPYIVICDIDCVEVYAENDDIDTAGGNYNAALEYTFETDGDYSVAVADCSAMIDECEDTDVTGEFHLLLGYGEPDILNGTAESTGAEVAVPYSTEPIPTPPPPAPITGEPQIQEFYAQVTEEVDFSYFDLFGMQAGETIYIYAESDEIDTAVAVCDIDCGEFYATADDIDADNLNTALAYTFEADGDYSIVVTDCCRYGINGAFHLLVGFNAPEILTGDALPNGAQIAIPYEDTYLPITPESEIEVSSDARIQQFEGELDPESRYTYYDIYGAAAGETLYLYAESNDFDTELIVCDIECDEVFAENDDISERNFNSALEFTFPADGDYTVAVGDCCDDNASGSFVLQLGYHAPEVLRGEGIPNGAEIAQEYLPDRPDVPDVVRDESATCAELELGERPELSGPVQTVETENFVIHYTQQGEDAATDEFVGEVLSFVEKVLEVQTQQLGWPLPPRDCGEGGDTRFDFYLVEILDEGILGYAQPENIVGNNPNSELNETWAGYSFLAIDNDFQGVTPPLSVMRATVAHEFHHGIQFGYDVNDAFNWYYESTASWIETQTSPEDEDATGYTAAVFRYPDLCIGTLDEETGVRVYGEWLLIDSLAQDFGNEGIMRMWELIADNEGMNSYYMFLNEMGSSPQDALRRYAVRNLLRATTLGDSLPETVVVEGVISDPEVIQPRRNGVQEMSVDYVLIRRRGNYTFSIDNRDLSLVVVGVDKGTGQAQVFDLGQSGTVDTTEFSNAYVIILNNLQHSDINDCSYSDWELTVTDGSRDSQTPANGEVFDAQNFVPAG
jgi:hypothetical protein